MKRILIAEDDEDTLHLLKRLLCCQDVDCEAVINGQLAIEAYDRAQREKRPFDLLTLDAAMPHKTGYEVTEHVRKGCFDAVPIIIVTAHTEPLAKPHADYAGATDLWTKPIDPTKFKERVQSLLRGEPRENWSQSGVNKMSAY